MVCSTKRRGHCDRSRLRHAAEWIVAASEFELIRRFFADATPNRADVVLGIGDDCALLQPAPEQTIAVSIDTLVAGRHFLPDVDPAALGHKALAVNLSDLAAMGATPAWLTLAITLPAADLDWLAAFMRGFAALAEQHRVQLVGGDTTGGPLSVTIQAHGLLPVGRGLRRSGASPGDRLFVSGTLGDAALALRHRRAGLEAGDLQARLDRPTPRVALGLLLRDIASAAIDVSDGLHADLGHLCAASGVAARVVLAQLPLSAAVREACKADNWQLPLAGGDDYELLFSVAPERIADLKNACQAINEPIREIGELRRGAGITLIYPDGSEGRETPQGYDHFKS